MELWFVYFFLYLDVYECIYIYKIQNSKLNKASHIYFAYIYIWSMQLLTISSKANSIFGMRLCGKILIAA